jgi:hypothetical protein
MEFYLALMFTFSDIGPRALYYGYDGPLGMLACSGSRQEFEKDRAETEGMAGAIFHGKDPRLTAAVCTSGRHPPISEEQRRADEAADRVTKDFFKKR